MPFAADGVELAVELTVELAGDNVVVGAAVAVGAVGAVARDAAVFASERWRDDDELGLVFVSAVVAAAAAVVGLEAVVAIEDAMLSVVFEPEWWKPASPALALVSSPWPPPTPFSSFQAQIAHCLASVSAVSVQ